MNIPDHLRHPTAANGGLTLLLIGGLTLARLAIAASLGLGVDESHYVMYSRQPAWGYFDHPPMVAFLALLTRPLGTHPFWIRLGPVLCSAVAQLLLRRLALTLGYRERAAFFAVAVINLLPGFHVMAPALLPDATLNVFWILALTAAWQALHRGLARDWAMTGLAFGLSMLSKYHGVLIAASLVVFVLTTPEHRSWIRRPHAYLAGLAGLAVFTPNILWNARHEWLSYAFQLAHGGGRGVFTWSNAAEAVGGQLAFAGPVLMILLPAAAIRAWREGHQREAHRFLAWTSLPVFLFFMIIGSRGKILPHWPFVGWWAGALLVGAMLDQRLAAPSRRWRRAWNAAVVTSGLAIAALYAVLFLPIVPRLYHPLRDASMRLSNRHPRLPVMPPYESKFDPSNDLYGWDRIAAEALAVHQAQPDPRRTFLFCHRFFTTSQVAVHLPGHPPITSLNERVDQYRLWFKAGDYRGWDAIFIDHDRFEQGPERYRHLFEGSDPDPLEFTLWRGRHPAHRIRFYRYTGFKGRYDGET